MPYRIQVHEIGGPEKLCWENTEIMEPGPTEVRVRNEAIGLNFVDTYYRSGLYTTSLPFTPGAEGAGTVEAVGTKVKGFKPGDRVAYADPLGAYGEVGTVRGRGRP